MPRKKKEDIDFDYEFATFEDISSVTFEQPKKKSVLDYVKVVEDGFLNNIGKIIKITSFVVAALILLAFLGIGVVISLLDSFFIFIAVILFIIGTRRYPAHRDETVVKIIQITTKIKRNLYRPTYPIRRFTVAPRFFGLPFARPAPLGPPGPPLKDSP